MPLLNNVQNQKGSPALFTDLLANIPLAGFTGRLFIASDTKALYRDNGVTWDLIGAAGGGGITGSGTAGNLAKFTSASVIANSIVSELGTIITVAGNIIATKFIAVGGTTAQFLKGNGDLDSNTYVPTSQISGTSGTVPLFGAGNSVVNSVITQSASIVIIGGARELGIAALQSGGGPPDNYFANYAGVFKSRTFVQVLADIGAQPQLNGVGFVKANGTSISYDNSNYVPTSQISGTTGTVPLFGASNSLGNSLITQSAGNITIGGTVLITSVPAGTIAPDTYLGSYGGTVKGRTVSQVLTDISAQPQLNGTGFVKATGTTISYDNNNYVPTSQISGTSGTVPLFGAGNSVVNSVITQSASLVIIGGARELAIGFVQSGGGPPDNYFANYAGVLKSRTFAQVQTDIGGPFLTSAVTSFGVINGSGFQFTLTNPTTTPVISLTTQLNNKSVVFIGASGIITEDNANFTFDNTVNRFSVLASNPFTSNTSYISSFGSCALTGAGFNNTLDVIGAGVSGALGLAMTGAVTLYKKSVIGAVVGRTYLNSVAGSITVACGVGGSFEFANTGNITDACSLYAQAPYQQLAQPAFTGTATRFSGLLIEDLRGNTDISARITTMYAIRQLGLNDLNYFAGGGTFGGAAASIRLGTNGSDFATFNYSGGGASVRNDWASTSAFIQLFANGGGVTVYGNTLVGNQKNVATFDIISDGRIKENKREITNALDKILRLKVYTVDYTDNFKKVKNVLKGNNIDTFIAQEYMEVFPDNVNISESKELSIPDLHTIDLSPLLPNIVKAIQELYSLIKK